MKDVEPLERTSLFALHSDSIAPLECDVTANHMESGFKNQAFGY